MTGRCFLSLAYLKEFSFNFQMDFFLVIFKNLLLEKETIETQATVSAPAAS